MQTAVETLIAKIKAVKPTQFCSIETILEWCEQAKEMEREQHGKTWDSAIEQCEKRAWNLSRLYTDFDDYFAETYGSNHIVDTNEMVSSQTEISDEEIEEASLNIEHYNLDMIVMERIMWRKGAKWYREQLKQRQ